jgi:hypothetical protein
MKQETEHLVEQAAALSYAHLFNRHAIDERVDLHGADLRGLVRLKLILWVPACHPLSPSSG